MPTIVLGSLAAILYLVTGGLLGLRLSLAGSGQSWNKAGPLILGLSAVVLHAILLSQVTVQPEGINLGFFNALSFSGCLIALVLLVSAIFRPVENLGIILLPFSAVTVILALVFSSERIVADSDQWFLELHIIVSILAYSLLALASVQAILLAIQDRRLRNRHPGGFVRGIPPSPPWNRCCFR